MGSRDDNVLAALLQISEQIAKLNRAEPAVDPRTQGYSDGTLADLAAAIYGARIERSRHFDMNLFGEPAWDMLLDLFLNTARGLRLGTTSLCMGSNMPPTTALRHIERLEAEGLLRRYKPADDRRLNCVEMTPRGKKLMREYLSSVIGRLAPHLRR